MNVMIIIITKITHSIDNGKKLSSPVPIQSGFQLNSHTLILQQTVYV